MSFEPNLSDHRTKSDTLAPLLQLSGLRKVYQTLVANDNIELIVKRGEIHAVLGENGAGKSTMMKMIYGVIQPTAGQIIWEGQPVLIANPAYARTLGIGMVFQHFSLFETLSVVENVALGLSNKPNLKRLARQINEVADRYGLSVDPYRSVHALSVGERQRIEIIRCLLQKPKLLIMDEPTSVLTPQAVRKLFETLRQLSSEGCSILYISHKLDEIQELCHTATVLRAGKVSGTCTPLQETPQSMAKMMIGKDIPVCQLGPVQDTKEVQLRLAGFSYASRDPFGVDLKDIHLDVHTGEIVGIAGVSGNGQQELLYAISGEIPITEKYPIQICGVQAGKMRPRDRRRLGLCFVPEERLGRGAVPQMTLSENSLLTMGSNGVVTWGLINFNAVETFTKNCIEAYNVKCSGSMAAASSLSGGNLQKFIVGREMLQCPKVLVMSQPTWGVDVGAAAFIRQSMIDLRNQGASILVVSEELDELFEVCDRIAVIAKGKLSPIKRTCDTHVEEIGVWMSGIWPGATDTVEPIDEEKQKREERYV